LKETDGFSITIPYKELFLNYLDISTSEVAMIGAANSIKVENSQLIGYNTDWNGFISPLSKFMADIKKVLVIGYGGGARAVIYGLIKINPAIQISIYGRNESKIIGFCQAIAVNYRRNVNIVSLTKTRLLTENADYDLTVNCTPLGSKLYPNLLPLPNEYKFSDKTIYYDLIYNPLQTKYLARAEEAGSRTINGLWMLVHQAIESYIVWSKDNVRVEIIRDWVLEKIRVTGE
jgi:shikimate dehydrogenase